MLRFDVVERLCTAAAGGEVCVCVGGGGGVGLVQSEEKGERGWDAYIAGSRPYVSVFRFIPRPAVEATAREAKATIRRGDGGCLQ